MKSCSNCLMDTTAKEIVFDKFGVCNFCKETNKKLDILKMKKKIIILKNYWRN